MDFMIIKGKNDVKNEFFIRKNKNQKWNGGD